MLLCKVFSICNSFCYNLQHREGYYKKCRSVLVCFQWASASSFISKHVDPENTLELAPPQTVELGRILHFNDAEKLKQFSWERSKVRVQRWFPVVCTCDDGVLFLYPGKTRITNYIRFVNVLCLVLSILRVEVFFLGNHCCTVGSHWQCN